MYYVLCVLLAQSEAILQETEVCEGMVLYCGDCIYSNSYYIIQ